MLIPAPGYGYRWLAATLPRCVCAPGPLDKVNPLPGNIALLIALLLCKPPVQLVFVPTCPRLVPILLFLLALMTPGHECSLVLGGVSSLWNLPSTRSTLLVSYEQKALLCLR